MLQRLSVQLSVRRLFKKVSNEPNQRIGRISGVATVSDGLRSPSCVNHLAENRRHPEVSESGPLTAASALQVAGPTSGSVVAIEWCIFAGLAVTFVGQSVLPGWRTLKSEFPNYYLAAQLYHRGIPLDRVYEWTWFQRQNDHLGVRDGLVSFAPNPPTSILALLPFTRLQPLTAKRVWLVLSLACLALSLWALHGVTSLGWRRLGLISFFCVLPLRIDFLFGRYYVLILLFVCLAYYAARRDKHWASGAMWSASAAMKLFPALAVILFARTRNWRAVKGFVVGVATLAAVSVAVFGVEVHKVFLREVLSQASRGDWLGPYALSQNSFITLWSHLFLIEPELNPSPWINSPPLYALAMALTVTVLVFVFLSASRSEKTPQVAMLHWAALIPLLLLVSTTSAPDHSCLLIFTVVVGVDALLAMGCNKKAIALVLLYVAACAPLPDRVSNWFPLYRLAAITALYALLLHSASAGHLGFPPKRWLVAGLLSVVLLMLYNLHAIRNRTEDFSWHLSTSANAYRFANPVPVGDEVAFTEMQPSKYGAAIRAGEVIHEISMPGDVLSVAGSDASGLLYAELTGRKSFIVRLPTQRLGSDPEILTEGQEPALSPNGKWLAFIREEQGRGTAWLVATDFTTAPQTALSSAYQPLDLAVTDDGDVIAAAGNVSDPHLLLVKRSGRGIGALQAFPHPARYPSISPDGKRLAFSQRSGGSWHLIVRTLATGSEQQLTHAACNAISPSWASAQTLLYATDCGRGVGLSAIARTVVPN